MQLEDALDTLVARLSSIDGLTVTTDPTSPVVPPMAVILDGELDYNVSFGRGAALLAFEVTVYVSKVDAASGLSEARGYLSGHGDTSVRQALDTPSSTDDLLAKVVVDTGVREASDSYMTAVFACRAHIPGATAT